MFLDFPVPVVVFGITQVISWTDDEEAGRVEMLVSQPLPRVQLLLGRYAAMRLAMAVIVAVAGAAAPEEVGRGTRLLGAVEALSESLAVGLDVDDRLRYERGVASAHTQLSEAEFTEAWQEGRALSLEQAIQCALEGK